MSEPNTNKPWWGKADEDPVHLAAMDWFARLEDPQVSLEDTLAWQKWMEADARHAEAFARIDEVSAAMRYVRSPPRPRSWTLALDHYDASIPLGQWRSSARPRLGIAASVVLAAVALAWVMLSSPVTEVLSTAVGENRTVALQDGSTVTLGGATRVEVAFTEQARVLELARGEAFFTVAKDKTRPFKVRVSGAAVVAVGTAFNVRRGSDRTVVAVTEGRVMIEPASGLFKPKLTPVQVDAGEQSIAARGSIELASPLKDPAAATAWQTGRLAFRLQPLRYVLEDVNRYTAKPIVVADKNIGTLVITGTVSAADIGEWITSLEQAFELEAIEEPERIVIRER